MSEITAINLSVFSNELTSISVTQKEASRGAEGFGLSAVTSSRVGKAAQKDSVSLSKTAKKQKDEEKSTSIRREDELSEQEKQKVRELKETDRKVRAHEQAHIRAGGDLIRGMAQYTYDVGPDKKRYAVAGEVSIDTSPVKDDPEATIRKAERIKKTALAPADPSSQDRAVAAEADHMAMQARLELARAQQEQTSPASGRLFNLSV